MADNTTLNSGTGGDVIATDDVAGVKYQRVKLVDGTADSTAAIPGDATNGLLVNLGANNDVTNAGTFPVQESGAALTALQLIDDAVATTAAAIPAKGLAAVGTDGTNARILKTDAAGELQIDVLTMPTTTVTGTVTLGTGAATIGALSPNQSVNTAQINGVAPTMGNGVSGAGVQRVTIASDSTGQVALAAGSATVGNVGLATRTTGGLTTFHLVSAATTNATVVKASAGQLYGYYIYNNNAAMRKVAFHNSASTPTAGASIFFTINVPPNSAANVSFEMGIAFSAGIAITMVTDNTDAGATAVAAGDLTANLFYA